VISNSVPAAVRSGHEAAWEYDAPKFVEFESHDVSMAYYNAMANGIGQNLGIELMAIDTIGYTI